MYDNYYTGSDVNVYLYYPLTDKRVHVDKSFVIIFSVDEDQMMPRV